MVSPISVGVCAFFSLSNYLLWRWGTTQPPHAHSEIVTPTQNPIEGEDDSHKGCVFSRQIFIKWYYSLSNLYTRHFSILNYLEDQQSGETVWSWPSSRCSMREHTSLRRRFRSKFSVIFGWIFVSGKLTTHVWVCCAQDAPKPLCL